MDRLSQDDAALFAAARVSRDLARLPGAPGPDWCERAAGALSQAAPGTLAWVGVVRPGRAGGRAAVERSGSVDSSADPRSPEATARSLRALARFLCSRVDPPPAGVHALDEVSGGGIRIGRDLAQLGDLLVGIVPLAETDVHPTPVLVAFWASWADSPLGLTQDELRRVLRSALPMLGERLRVALGAGGRRAPWLSEREQRVLDLLTSGLSVPEIAALLGRSQHTVHDYVKNLHRKLGTSSRGALIARALGHQGPAGYQLGRRGVRRAPGPMLAFRTDGRTAFVDHWLS